jgi:hypothetical protein
LILILSNDKHSSRNTRVLKGIKKSIVNTTQKYTRIIVQVINDPLSDLSKVLFFKTFDKIVDFDIREFSKD